MLSFNIKKIISFAVIIATTSTISLNTQKVLGAETLEKRYIENITNIENNTVPQNAEITITPSKFKNSTGTFEQAQGYNGSVANLFKKDKVYVEVDIKDEGFYDISLDYFPKGDSLVGNKISLLINGEYPYYEAREMILPQLWESEKYPFDMDNKGNEIVPKQKDKLGWYTTKLKSISQGTTDSIKFYLTKGVNELEFTLEEGNILLGDIKFSSPQKVESYSEYIANKQVNTSGNSIEIIEAERINYKNATTPRPLPLKDVEAVPYDGKNNLLSMVGGETWEDNGQALYYEIDIKESGWYNLSFKAKQTSKSDFYVYRTITIDGEVPFKEAKQIPFKSSRDWYVQTISDGTNPYSFYLEQGTHLLGIEVDTSLFNPIVNNLTAVNNQISDLSLQIKKIIGNNTDRNRDWEMLKFIPTLDTDILNIAKVLEEEKAVLTALNMNNERSREITTLKIAINQLQKLAEKPNNIPNQMSTFSEGSGSVSQMLGDVTQFVMEQPLELDQIYLHKSDASLPKYKAGVMKKISENMKYFIGSFFPPKYYEDKNMVVLDIWTNRSRSHVDLLQKMIDNEFTPNTNIKVNLSIMPNEQKIILANTTNTQPDIGLGLSTYLPYELAIRDAALDLRKFDDFSELASQFSPGAFITHTIGDSIYAFPETQDFYVLFYRKDLLEGLGIPIPNTWDDVKNILPELQRYGMNYYVPIANESAFKAFQTTIPYIYQYGGSLYSEDGMHVVLNNEQGLEATKLMTDLFTIYGMPMQVPNFYQHFRSGKIPIGVSNFGDYIRVVSAASELSGAWDISLQPGIVNNEGVVERWSPGPGQTAMIFSKSKYQNESWEFLKWWLSSEIQTQFGRELKMLYGNEYIWNTANMDAFKSLPMNEQHKEIILEQWEWLQEVPKVPGGYIVERGISDIWNKIVFDGENPRSTLDDGIIVMNREISRKLEEFGYMKNGVKVKDYRVPTVKLIESWVR